ncbi:MAG: DUF2163 domain-containing protein [Alphaproteobacteria bacterium]
MKFVPQSMQRGAMTLSRCWRLIRRDKEIIAFTDHDGDLVYGDICHRAVQGLESSAHESGLGFSTKGSEASGILLAPGLIEDDIVNGLYDGARVEIDLVDWLNTEARIRIETGIIGEITRSSSGFNAEIRSLTTLLDEERGRLFRPSCAAELGDKSCTVQLDGAPFSKECVVQSTDGRRFISLYETIDVEYFNRGAVSFLNGGNKDTQIEVQLRQERNGRSIFLLWQPTREAILVNERVLLIAGCDKEFSTCRDIYKNSINFRGFPHLPGNDFVISFVADGTPGMDGGSLFK